GDELDPLVTAYRDGTREPPVGGLSCRIDLPQRDVGRHAGFGGREPHLDTKLVGASGRQPAVELVQGSVPARRPADHLDAARVVVSRLRAGNDDRTKGRPAAQALAKTDDRFVRLLRGLNRRRTNSK